MRKAFNEKTSIVKGEEPASLTKSPSTVRGRKRHRSPSSGKSPEPEPYRPRKLFQGPHKVGKTTKIMSNLQVTSPTTTRMAPGAEKVVPEGNTSVEQDAGEKGDDEG